MRHECKITVLETKCFPELQEKYLAGCGQPVRVYRASGRIDYARMDQG